MKELQDLKRSCSPIIQILIGEKLELADYRSRESTNTILQQQQAQAELINQVKEI